jgi:hypothetical protein
MSAIATRIDIEATEKNLAGLQKEADKIKNEIRKAINALISESEELEDDIFWTLLEELKNRITRHSTDSEFNSACVKVGVNNFIHSVVFDHIRDLDTDRHTAVRFIKSYSTLTNKLSHSLWNVIEGYGDDGYGDCIDSFPLFGREVVEKALEEELDVDPYQGENYVVMNLNDSLTEYFGTSCYYDYCDEEDSE